MEQKFYTSPAANDPELTITTPRFDMEAAQLARPVVPFTSSKADHQSLNPLRAASGFRTNRSWPLSLIIISALIGGVAGGLGLGLYQRRRTEVAPVAVTSPPAASVASMPQPSPAATQTDDQELRSSTAVEIAEKPGNPIRRVEASNTETMIDVRTMGNVPKSEAARNAAPTLSPPRQSPAGTPSGRSETDPRTIQRPRRSQQPQQVEHERAERLRVESEPGREAKPKPRIAETPRTTSGDESEPRRTVRANDKVIESQERRSDVIESKPQRKPTITDIFEGPPLS